jgi:selenocysteine-specific elongation factor
MKRVIIGTAGHIDHGKSALVKALTGVDPDRLKEEKERGITIELGFASLDLPSGAKGGIVDVPGHEKFVRNMVAGATGIDIVLLIIAADEGVMPQTREHTDICRLLGIPAGIVVLTKIDKVEKEWLDLVEEEVRGFKNETFLSGAPIVKVSSVTRQGLDELIKNVDSVAKKLTERSKDRPLKYPIDRIFSLKGIGTVVTGTLQSGMLRRESEVAIMPRNRTARVRYLESHGEKHDEATPGSRTAANLTGIDKEDLARGDVITGKGEVVTTTAIDALVENLTVNKKPFRFGTKLNIHYGTTYVEAVLQPYGRHEVSPGESGIVRIHLFKPAVLFGKERFILRGFTQLENFGYTVGGGVVINPYSPRRRPGRIDEAPGTLRDLLNGNTRNMVLAASKELEGGPIDGNVAALMTGLEFKEASRALDELAGEKVLRKAGEAYLLVSLIEEVSKQVLSALSHLSERERAKGGFTLTELRARTGRRVDPRFVDEAIKALIADGNVVKTKDGFLPAKMEEARSTIMDELGGEITKFIEKRKKEGPTLSEIANHTKKPVKDVQHVLNRLVRDGAVTRSRDFFFSEKSLKDIEADLTGYLKNKEKITISQFKDITGTSRKYSVPLMELMDQRKVTIRQGDYRVLWKKQ